MDYQKQCCTQVQAHKLKSLGIFTGGALFLFDGNGLLHFNGNHRTEVAWYYDNGIPAYTVAELGVMLPEANNNIVYPNGDHARFYWPYFRKVWNDWICEFGDFFTVECGTEAEARADVLIYLIKEGVVTPEEINVRLNA